MSEDFGDRHDAAITDYNLPASGISLLKGILKSLRTGIGTFVIGAGSAIIGATKDAGANWTSVWGVAGVPFSSANASAAPAAVTDVPGASLKIVVTDLVISVDTSLTVTLTEQTSGTVIEKFYMPANSVLQYTPRGKRKLATAARALMVQTSATGNIVVNTGYYYEA